MKDNRTQNKKPEPCHMSETTKRYLIKNIGVSNLSPGDKRTITKMVNEH